MRSLLLIGLISSTAFAQERQICLDQVEAQHIARYIQRTEAERDALKKEIQNQPSPVLPAIIVGVISVVVAGGIGVAVGASIPLAK